MLHYAALLSFVKVCDSSWQGHILTLNSWQFFVRFPDASCYLSVIRNQLFHQSWQEVALGKLRADRGLSPGHPTKCFMSACWPDLGLTEAICSRIRFSLNHHPGAFVASHDYASHGSGTLLSVLFSWVALDGMICFRGALCPAYQLPGQIRDPVTTQKVPHCTGDWLQPMATTKLSLTNWQWLHWCKH